MKHHCLSFALVALAVGCSSIPDPNPDLGAPPQNFHDFEAVTEEYSVLAKAKVVLNHREAFGVDLFERGIIPISLTVSAQSELADQGKVQLVQNGWDPHLYLQDGSAFLPLTLDELRAASSAAYKVASGERFNADHLNRDGLKGFLFFQVPLGAAYQLRDQVITHKRGKYSRGLQLYHALLSFNVSINHESLPIFVGVKPQ